MMERRKDTDHRFEGWPENGKNLRTPRTLGEAFGHGDHHVLHKPSIIKPSELAYMVAAVLVVATIFIA
jgi:hypothetical protein